MSRQPRGPAHPVDDRWKLAAREELARREMSQTDLARAVGATDPTISLLLRTAAESKEADRKPVEQSRFAVRVSEVLGIGLPGPAMDEDLAAHVQLAQQLQVIDSTFLRRANAQMKRALRQWLNLRNVAYVPRDFADLVHRLPGSAITGTGVTDETGDGMATAERPTKRRRKSRRS